MIKLPLIVLYAIIAFNITTFAVLLQLDILIYHSPIAKGVTWALAGVAWGFAYANRNKFMTFRYGK
jgi:hypothetical protein